MQELSVPTLDLCVPPEAQYARTVRGSILQFARSHNIIEEDIELFLTALGEALANAIEHSRSERLIHIRCRITEERVIAMICDSGVGFSSTTFLPTGLPHPMAEGGRGLPLMRRCSDIFRVRSVPGKGTTVLIGRNLHESDFSRP
jgi:anti-sigma regulatory factor (Ser/Thr protein kinase)